MDHCKGINFTKLVRAHVILIPGPEFKQRQVRANH